MSLGEEANGPLRRPLGKGAIVQILNHVDFWRFSTKTGQEGRPPRAPANYRVHGGAGGGEHGEEKAALQDALLAGGA